MLGVRDLDFTLDRLPASPAVADLVERHWLVTWDLPPGRRRTVQVLPHPCVNLYLDDRTVLASGVTRDLFSYECAGSGRAFGTKFRPGAFRSFLREPVSALTDRAPVPLASLWGAADAARLGAELAAADGLDALAAITERHLLAHWPAPDPEVYRVREVVHTLLYDRSVTRVDDVARRFGRSPRSLQRLFREYVGVTPKWVLQRYRLHEAAARLADDRATTWTAIAADLGYFDQSHFIRDFTRAVGMTPTAYAEMCARRQSPVAA